MEEDDGYGVNLFRVERQKMDAEFLSVVVYNRRGVVRERIDVRLVLPPSPVQRMSAMEYIAEHWERGFDLPIKVVFPSIFSFSDPTICYSILTVLLGAFVGAGSEFGILEERFEFFEL
jgi:hypothetical protein